MFDSAPTWYGFAASINRYIIYYPFFQGIHKFTLSTDSFELKEESDFLNVVNSNYDLEINTIIILSNSNKQKEDSLPNDNFSFNRKFVYILLNEYWLMPTELFIFHHAL